VREARTAVMIVVDVSWEDPGEKGGVFPRGWRQVAEWGLSSSENANRLGSEAEIQSRFEQFSAWCGTAGVRTGIMWWGFSEKRRIVS